MTSDIKRSISALKFLTGEIDHICRFCLSPTEKCEVSFSKLIKHDLEFCSDILTYYDMLYELGIDRDELPQELCLDCAQKIISSYLLKKRYEFSSIMWENYINKLHESIIETHALHPETQTLFIILNNGDTSFLYSSKQKKVMWSKEEVLTKVQNMAESKERVDFVCKVCGDYFSSNLLLSAHKKEHNELKFACDECGKKFSSRLGMTLHIERMHNERTLKCDKCSSRFSTPTALKQHHKVSHEPVKCKLCSEECPSRIALRTHVHRHENLQCFQCKKNYINKITYKFHLTICGKDKPKPSFFCDLCSKSYIRKNGLRTHLKIDHGFGKVLSCDWCGKKYDAISKLKHHIVKHTREKNFHCEICGGRYVTSAALIYHTRLHTGEKPFPCDMCGESFLSSSRRTEHKYRRHMAPRQECRVCHRKFVTSTQLRKHEERHNNPQSKLFVPVCTS